MQLTSWGDYMVSCSWDQTISIWTQNGEFVRSFLGFKAAIICIKVFNNFLYSGGYHSEPVIRKWDISGNILSTIHAHNRCVESLEVWKNALWSCSADCTIKRWNSNDECDLVLTWTGIVSCILGWDDYLVSGHLNSCVVLWEWNANKNEFKPKVLTKNSASSSTIFCMKIFSNLIWTGHAGGGIMIWNKEQCISEIPNAHFSDIRSMAFVNNFLATGSFDNFICFWNKDQKKKFSIKAHSETVLCIYSFKNKLWTGSSDNSIRIWAN